LRKIEDKIAETLLPVTPESHPAGPDGAACRPTIGDGVTITLSAHTDTLRARIGAAPIPIASLPYIVGRLPAADEAEPPRRPDLLIEDREPFRLSRDHFMIMRSRDQLVISDLGSVLGTIVNGRPGQHFMRDTALLQRGDNQIIAGCRGSPFEFVLSGD
jgi:hypothetical protein